MVCIIPMAGKGSRFVKEGYTQPKYMISVNGKTLFEYSLDSLPLDIFSKTIFIALEEHKKYNLEKFIQSKMEEYPYDIIYLKDLTNGQAQTVCYAEKYIKNDDEILIYNIDTYFYSKNLRESLLDKTKKEDGILGAFIDRSDDQKWSFALLEDGVVVKTTEKEKISNFALTGLYHFSCAKDFFQTAKVHIENQITTKNEYYIAPLYNDLIKKGKRFKLDIVDSFIPLGTPKEVEDFANKH